MISLLYNLVTKMCPELFHHHPPFMQSSSPVPLYISLTETLTAHQSNKLFLVWMLGAELLRCAAVAWIFNMSSGVNINVNNHCPAERPLLSICCRSKPNIKCQSVFISPHEHRITDWLKIKLFMNVMMVIMSRCSIGTAGQCWRNRKMILIDKTEVLVWVNQLSGM